MFRSSNPFMRAGAFTDGIAYDPASVMTVQGTANKTMILVALALISTIVVWGHPGSMLLLWPAAIIGFILAIVTSFKRAWAGVTAPLYAIVEGVVLGAISQVFERAYPGIVIQAVMLTFGTLISLLLAYQSRLIVVTDKFRLGVIAATGGIAIVYLISMVMGFFGMRMTFLYGGGLFSIGFSLLVVVIAALNLVLDFDMIERAAQAGAPKYMEWYGGFGLLVTLIWLYMELLRLLALTRRRQ